MRNSKDITRIKHLRFYVFFIIQCFIILYTVYKDNDFLRINAFLLFSIQAIVIAVGLYSSKIKYSYIFSPSILGLSYLIINLCLGGYLAPRGYGFYSDYQNVILNAQHIKFSVILLESILLSLFITSYLALKNLANSNILITELGNGNFHILKKKRLILISIFVYLSTLLTGLPAPFQFGALLILFNVFRRKKSFVRVLLYFGILLLSIWDYSHDKRNILIVLLIIILVEVQKMKSYIKFSLKNLLKLLAIGIIFLSLIITASINRGYGNKDVIEATNIILAIKNYVTADIFIDAITDNLELSYAYGGMINSIDLLAAGEMNFLLGVSVIKPVFIFIPRSIWPGKPWSLMHEYTKEYDYQGWIQGSSLPIPITIEFFANFHLFGLLFSILFFSCLDYLFKLYLIKTNPLNFKSFIGGFIGVTSFIIIRGSGLDLFVIYILSGLSAFYLIKIIYKYTHA